ncbi:Fe(II)-2OG oxygenase family protein [Streptomyces varsoviensis]|nr:hypothetical protein [Streptomyces varsoviensis]
MQVASVLPVCGDFQNVRVLGHCPARTNRPAEVFHMWVNVEEITDTDFAFEREETAKLSDLLLQIDTDPYADAGYPAFETAVAGLLDDGRIPQRFKEFCDEAREWPKSEHPVITLKGCPIDPDLPYLDFSDPVVDKRRRKKTYVSEAFLLVYALLMKQEPIGYANVNDGDVFQDIHPWDRLAHTQSQKALADIGFHKDLANHFVRPDWVNLLGLRQSAETFVSTSYTRNIDVLDDLSESQREVLSEPNFYTPFDDLTVAGNNVQLGEAEKHPVLGGASEYDIRVFENRTIGLTPDAQQAVYALVKLLHRHKRRFRILPGFFLGEANNESIHCKEIIYTPSTEALQHRWLQKTVNVADSQQHAHHFVPGRDRIVNG